MSATIWVCGACGKFGATRRMVGDESCYLHSRECWTDSLVMRNDWGVKAAVLASEPWVPEKRSGA